MTDSNLRKIDEEAAKYGELAKKQEEQHKQQTEHIAALDEIRGASREMADSLINDFKQGASGAKILRDELDILLSKLIEGGLNGALKLLLGEGGKAGGGVFGNMFGGDKSFWGSIASTFGLADGGIVGVHGSPMMAPIGAFAGAPHFASGGMVGAPRPIIAHDGELILNAAMQRNTAAALSAAQAAANASSRSPGLQMPKLVFENHAPGASVQPVFATHDEVRYAITSSIQANNKKQGEAAKRSA